LSIRFNHLTSKQVYRLSDSRALITVNERMVPSILEDQKSAVRVHSTRQWWWHRSTAISDMQCSCALV